MGGGESRRVHQPLEVPEVGKVVAELRLQHRKERHGLWRREKDSENAQAKGSISLSLTCSAIAVSRAAQTGPCALAAVAST